MKLKQPELNRARIEIVPMIDTIFFLLVFFMVASLSMVPLKSRHVALPESETARSRTGGQVVLTAASDGALYLDRRRVAENEILPGLRRRVWEDPRVAVLINCDRSLPASRFLSLFDFAKQAGAGSVMVATLPRAAGGKRR